MVVVAEELRADSVLHGARRVVHRAAEHTQVGNGDIVVGLVVDGALVVARFPLRVLHAFHPLEVDDVRKGTLDARGLQSVVVDDELVAGSCLGNAIAGTYDLLVVAIEEVDLEALDAHVGIVLHDRLELSHGGVGVVAHHVAPAAPQDDAHAAFTSVGHQLGYVDFGVEILDKRLAAAPALVNDDVLQTVLLCEVDVVFIGRGVHARLEADARQVGVVPPVPRHLAGTNPGGVGQAAFGCKALRHVAVQDVGIAFGHHDGTPGERTRSVDFCDEIGSFRRCVVQPAKAQHGLFERIGSEIGSQTVVALQQHHARIVLHAGIHDDGFQAAVETDSQGRDGQ